MVDRDDERLTARDAAAPAVRAARPPKERGYSAPWRARLARAGIAGAARLSLGSLHACGRLAGRGLARWPSRERWATRVNLALCLPELTELERRRLERESLRQAGCAIAEMAALWCWPAPRVLELVRDVTGFDELDAARRAHGALLLTPHLGAWELTGLYTGAHLPLTALYKAPRIRELESFYTACRERTGAKLVPADIGGVRALHRALKSGEVAGVLPDQDPGRGSGIFVPFFGVAANTTTLVAKLLARGDVPLFLVWCERLPDARGFHMHYVRACSPDVHAPDAAAATAAVNREIEALVRRKPEQYLWSYKRFRHRPGGQTDPYRRGEPPRDRRGRAP